MRGRLSKTGWVALLVGAVVCLAAGFGIGWVTRSARAHDAGPRSQPVGRTQLLRALALVKRFRFLGGYPFALSLVESLGLSDPGTRFQALSFPAQIPSLGTIGVYSSGDSVWLRARGQAATVFEARAVSKGPGAGDYGPYVVSQLSASDGDFSTPLTDAWTVQHGPIAAARLDSRVYLSSPSSLRVVGTGRPGTVATTVTQQIGGAMPTGTRYQVALMARTRALSRPVDVELKLSYSDGQYRFFEAQARDAAHVGIPRGTSKGWIPLQLTATASHRVTSAVLFAVDTGVVPLRGTAWIDNIAGAQGG